jgi:hypothetical protein
VGVSAIAPGIAVATEAGRPEAARASPGCAVPFGAACPSEACGFRLAAEMLEPSLP